MDTREGSDTLFTHATEGILIVNDKGEILRANPSAGILFGYETDELTGKKIELLVPKRLLKDHLGHRHHYNKNPEARSMGIGLDLYGLKKDGTEFPVEISLSPYRNDQGTFVIAFIIDITERKKAELKLRNYSEDLEKQVKNRTLILQEAIDELEKTKRDLNDALEKERELNELKSRFVSMASHEFRTPLATILSSLSLVTKYGEINEKEKQNKHIQRIKSSIGDLTSILNEFLSLSKLEEGKVENHPEEFNIQEFISDIVAELRQITKETQQIIYSHTGEESVSLDKKNLKNILFNLLSNAIKFSPDNEAVEVITDFSNSKINIQVKDKGVGIPEEDQKHLFERFFRASNVTHIQGTGLGLNIVAKYTELMNASIRVDSKENSGTTFTVTIPQ